MAKWSKKVNGYLEMVLEKLDRHGEKIKLGHFLIPYRRETQNGLKT